MCIYLSIEIMTRKDLKNNAMLYAVVVILITVDSSRVDCSLGYYNVFRCTIPPVTVWPMQNKTHSFAK